MKKGYGGTGAAEGFWKEVQRTECVCSMASLDLAHGVGTRRGVSTEARSERVVYSMNHAGEHRVEDYRVSPGQRSRIELVRATERTDNRPFVALVLSSFTKNAVFEWVPPESFAGRVKRHEAESRLALRKTVWEAIWGRKQTGVLMAALTVWLGLTTTTQLSLQSPLLHSHSNLYDAVVPVRLFGETARPLPHAAKRN
ncbi:hypothetical protein FA13DRAFT_1739502 [Coprinellus micaceus]|uniref:Uncharacterized protein n=1 Tax=Coprinellus micaceus TaxID=71717 RepID=A0A4Y7SQM0_COPMI|nr:hypothetical protein FA13DRAFT_1739502 [Coprinellus micaceus]